MPDVLTVREAVCRARAEGLPVSEYTLRQWVKQGRVPVRRIGRKALLFYPALVRFLQCGDGGDVQPVTQPEASGVSPLRRWG